MSVPRLGDIGLKIGAGKLGAGTGSQKPGNGACGVNTPRFAMPASHSGRVSRKWLDLQNCSLEPGALSARGGWTAQQRK